jgi:diguanylate cyclase (GGDEF)-like protein
MESPESTAPPLLAYPRILDALRIEFARARRYQHPLTCVLIQPDGIDQVDEGAGRGRSDAILQEVVALVRRQIRTSDSIGLYRDRVVLILPHTPVEGARAAAGRFRLALLGHLWPSFPKGPATASVGIAAFDSRRTTLYESILGAAERALEEALASGGDRVTSSSD